MPMTIELCLLLAVLCRVVALTRNEERRPAAAGVVSIEYTDQSRRVA